MSITPEITRGASIAPDGTVHPVPTVAEQQAAFAKIAGAAEAHRREGGEVVVVQGLGFVGAAVAAVVAGTQDGAGRPRFYVVGVDLDRPDSYWKVPTINAGRSPVRSPDTRIDRMIEDAVLRDRNLAATTLEQAYGLADVVIVDVHLDVRSRVVDGPEDIEVDLVGFQAALRSIGRHMRPDALVLIETTVPVGTCERLARPLLVEERRRRGIEAPLLLAHAYERVMPGPSYVDSVRALPRTFAGIDDASAARAHAFLSALVDPERAPLWRVSDPRASELAKLLENSYRATNIAFIHEWTLLAEKIGVNLFEVVDSIRVRKGTHDNMRYPGFGVGGYCLTKDSYLAQWGALHLLEADAVLGMTLEALRINHRMPRHTLDLVQELVGGSLAGRTVAVCGVSYIAEVADTRNSPAEMLVDELVAAGAHVRAHDPCLTSWAERPDVPLIPELLAGLAGVDAVVLAVPHRGYRDLAAEDLARALAPGAAVVDAQNVLSDDKARVLHAAGHRVVGVGKGHWRQLAYDRSGR